MILNYLCSPRCNHKHPYGERWRLGVDLTIEEEAGVMMAEAQLWSDGVMSQGMQVAPGTRVNAWRFVEMTSTTV